MIQLALLLALAVACAATTSNQVLIYDSPSCAGAPLADALFDGDAVCAPLHGGTFATLSCPAGGRPGLARLSLFKDPQCSADAASRAPLRIPAGACFPVLPGQFIVLTCAPAEPLSTNSRSVATQLAAPVGLRQLTGGACNPATSPAVLSISANFEHTCVVLFTGRAHCWGHNVFGQLGDGSTTDRSAPPLVDIDFQGTAVAQISAGYEHTCAVLVTGGSRCWGDNANGALGDGTTTRKLAPGSVNIDFGGALVTSLATGDRFTCAVLSTGGSRCWGAGDYGVLGIGSRTDQHAPLASDIDFGVGVQVIELSVSFYHVCALLRSGGATGARCWGYGPQGQRGDGSTTYDILAPPATNIDFQGVDVAQISAGGKHTCAVLVNSGTRCFGDNTKGQLGDGSNTGRSSPLTTDIVYGSIGSSKPVQISTGYEHTCVRFDTGGERCWGSNAYGQLGAGSTVSRNTPPESDIDFGTASVAAMLNSITGHSCAVTTAQGARCWGRNDLGQLGYGHTTIILSPPAEDMCFAPGAPTPSACDPAAVIPGLFWYKDQLVTNQLTRALYKNTSGSYAIAHVDNEGGTFWVVDPSGLPETASGASNGYGRCAAGPST